MNTPEPEYMDRWRELAHEAWGNVPLGDHHDRRPVDAPGPRAADRVADRPAERRVTEYVVSAAVAALVGLATARAVVRLTWRRAERRLDRDLREADADLAAGRTVPLEDVL